MAQPRHIDTKEFREFGYLQEANRLFFHPLGLALEVTIEDDGTEHLSGVWDYRDDPEGIIFDGRDLDQDKVDRVRNARVARFKARREILGYFIQPELEE